MKLILGPWLLKLQLKKYVFASGITSKCEDGRHVLLGDFDTNYNLPKIESIVRIMQERFDVGDCYIFKSDKNSYHVICPSKFTLLECFNILAFLEVEKNYNCLNFRRGYYTLRITGKGKRPVPEYVRTLYAPSKRHKSGAHCRWLALRLGKKVEDIIGMSDVDTYTKLKIDKYATWERHKRFVEKPKVFRYWSDC